MYALSQYSLEFTKHMHLLGWWEEPGLHVASTQRLLATGLGIEHFTSLLGGSNQ